VLSREVQLEQDIEERDEQRRLLAYVWLDGNLLNLKLVADGLAGPSPKYPNMMHSRENLSSDRDASLLNQGWRAACS
jgi:micrococcal nuclease